jgi:hypothetical protein
MIQAQNMECDSFKHLKFIIMEITIKINEKSLRWTVALILGSIVLIGLIGLFTNALTPEGFHAMQSWE